MLHQASLVRPPLVERVERLAPPIFGRLRPSGAFLHQGELVYRVPAGLGAGAEGRLLIADPERARYLSAESAGELIIAKRIVRGMIPPIPEAIVFLRGGGALLEVPGQCFAISRRAKRAVVADLRSGALWCVDLRRLPSDPRRIGTIEGVLEPRFELPMWLSDDGEVLLYPEAGADRSGSRLIRLDLGTGRKRVVYGPISGPAWVSGIRTPGAPSGRILSLTLRLAPRPRFELRLAERLLLALDQPQPSHPPTLVGPDHVAMVLSPEPSVAGSPGPSDLYLVSLRAGVLHRLTSTGDVRGRTRLEGEQLFVEGGSAVLRATLSR
ncbi:MAG: hypothetical protein U1E65_30545 [Myxococcota bacterium]